MNSKQNLSYAIVAILSAAAVGPARAADTADSGGLEEVVVTAQRRTENLQDVPISIQALTGETLSKLNVALFDDFVKYLPNVTTSNLGPGQGNIYMRGLSVGSLGTQGSGSVGQIPTVQVYLDEQPTALPGRNLDIYAADIERVEVLEGPQGTLFGAGAEAGVVRFITNKPKLNVTEGNVNAGYGTTAHGDDNANLDAMLNIPLIEDKLAIRAVIYNDSRGGYIDNVPGTFTRKPTDCGVAHSNGGSIDPYCYATKPGVVPNNSVAINNYNIAANNINPVTYKGLRLSALYKFNTDWDLLVTQSYQQMDAEGVFYEMPYASDGGALQPLQVTLFNPSYDKDKFSNTAWTVNGRLGDLKLVYDGAYLTRSIDQVQDYTNYARGKYGFYYQCAGYNGKPSGGTCYTPSSVWTDAESNTNLTQELRLSTPDDWRFRLLGGAFYEATQINDNTSWLYRSVPTCSAPTTANPGSNNNCFLPQQTPAGQFGNNTNLRNPNSGFYDDFQRNIDQWALFASGDAELIPKTVILTLGTRYYNINDKVKGGDVGSFYCKRFTPTNNFSPCSSTNYGNYANVVNGVATNAPYGTNVGAQANANTKVSGFKSRANLTWKITPNALVYGTWSQGYRPGGFNRGISCHLPDSGGINQYCIPETYSSDSLTNYEIGWKTELFERRLQFNGAVYQENWNNVQTGIFSPAEFGNLTVAVNGPDYRVRGVETQIIGRVTQEFTLTGSAAWNSSDLTTLPAFVNNNPKSPTYGQVITTSCTAGCAPFINPFGSTGSPLANSPPFQGNIRGRYEWAVNQYNYFAQLGLAYSAHSLSNTVNYTGPAVVPARQWDQPSWTTVDGSIGVAKDAWRVELVGQNLTDENKSLYTTASQFVQTNTPMRPRTLSLRFGYKFADK